MEKESVPQKVLKKNFPGIPIYGDIREFNDLIIDNEIDMRGRKRNPKYDEAVKMYNSGLSIAHCSEFFNVSRQSMHRILGRRSVEFRNNLKYGEDNHFYRGKPTNSKKKRVQHIVDKAVHRGILENSEVCEDCGQTKTFEDGRTGIQAHHDDYDKPLEVRWLCQKCHHEWHINNEAKNPKDEKEASAAIDIVTGGFP